MRARQTTEPAEAGALRAEIGQDMRVPANHVAKNGDPAAELREMFEAPDTAGLARLASDRESPPQRLARCLSRPQRQRVDDGEAEAAGRHGVLFRRLVLVEGDLHAGNPWHRTYFLNQ